LLKGSGVRGKKFTFEVLAKKKASTCYERETGRTKWGKGGSRRTTKKEGGSVEGKFGKGGGFGTVYRKNICRKKGSR